MNIITAFNELIAALTRIYPSREARIMATYVFEDVFGWRSQEPNASALTFTPTQLATFQIIQQRLGTGEPWQYVTGKADFYGIQLQVDKNVLIPRPETEELVYGIIQTIKKIPNWQQKNWQILDIGTGSGCIAIIIKKEIPNAKVLAIDISEGALQLAQQNAAAFNLAIDFIKMDILDRAHWKDFASQYAPLDIIVSNPPYIPHHEKAVMRHNVLAFEPQEALFVDNDDPLIFYDAIADFAQMCLSTNGLLFFEINEHLGKAMTQLHHQKGFSNCQLHQDMSGKDRWTVAWSH